MAVIPPDNSSQLITIEYQESNEDLSSSSVPYLSIPYAEASSSSTINATAAPSNATTDKTTESFQNTYPYPPSPSHTPPIFQIITSPPIATPTSTDNFTQAVAIFPDPVENLPTIEEAKAMRIKNEKQIPDCQYLVRDPKSSKGDSLLLKVCEAGRADLVTIFIENMRENSIGKTRPEQCNSQGATCLHKACLSGNLDTVLYAILKPTKKSLKSSTQKMIQGTAHDIGDGISYLAAPKNKQALLDKPTNSGESPLKLAVEHGHFDIVRALIYSGATYNEKNYQELLQIAIERQYFQTAYFLLLRALEMYRRYINKKISYDKYAYQRLSFLQDPTNLKKVIPFQCDHLNEFLNMVKKEADQISHLSIAEIQERAFKLKTVQSIMPYRFPDDRKQEIWTASAGDPALFKILEQHYDFSQKCMIGMMSHCLEKIFLQDKGEYFDALNRSKIFLKILPTSFHQAAADLALSMLEKMSKILTQEGMRIERHEKNHIISLVATNKPKHKGEVVNLPNLLISGVSPLEAALAAVDTLTKMPNELKIKNFRKIIEILLNLGFNPANGLVYLVSNPKSGDEALQKERLAVVNLLLEKGADVNAKLKGVSCLLLAKRNNHPEIAKILISKGATEG